MTNQFESLAGALTTSDDNNNKIIGTGNRETYGRGGNDLIIGQDGDDQLYGGEGDDFLFGGEGVNHLIGGTGRDVFVLDKKGVAVIHDFTLRKAWLILGRDGLEQFMFKHWDNELNSEVIDSLQLGAMAEGLQTRRTNSDDFHEVFHGDDLVALVKAFPDNEFM